MVYLVRRCVRTESWGVRRGGDPERGLQLAAVAPSTPHGGAKPSLGALRTVYRAAGHSDVCRVGAHPVGPK